MNFSEKLQAVALVKQSGIGKMIADGSLSALSKALKAGPVKSIVTDGVKAIEPKTMFLGREPLPPVPKPDALAGTALGEHVPFEGPNPITQALQNMGHKPKVPLDPMFWQRTR